MMRYVARRLAQMIPTLFGVILVTFLLFNVAGGSPARMKLGDKATAQALEEFDEQRGFNKPLFFGTRAATRAWADAVYAAGPGAWARVPGAEYEAATGGFVRLPPEAAAAPPLACALRAGVSYEWRARWRTVGEAAWREDRAVFTADAGTALRDLLGGGAAEVAALSLRRVMPHPWDSQLVFFLRQLARFDLGVSSSANVPVSDLLREGIGPTLSLTVPVLVLETGLGVLLALLCAWWRDRWLDRALVVAAVALMSVNYLVLIVGGQYLFAYRLGWFPVWGYASWQNLALPVLVGALSGLGAGVRFYRTVLLDELYRDYVRAARARGAGPVAVMVRHVLPNAMIPIITNVVLSVPYLYTGSLLLESFFGIPGLGYLGVNAIHDSDVDVVRAVVVLGSVLYLAANLLADLLYAVVDPRVRLA